MGPVFGPKISGHTGGRSRGVPTDSACGAHYGARYGAHYGAHYVPPAPSPLRVVVFLHWERFFSPQISGHTPVGPHIGSMIFPTGPYHKHPL